MIDLTKCKFGDKFETRDGRMAIIIKGHRHPRKPWFEAIVGKSNCELPDSDAYTVAYYADGTAKAEFTDLDLIKEIKELCPTQKDKNLVEKSKIIKEITKRLKIVEDPFNYNIHTSTLRSAYNSLIDFIKTRK